MKEKNDHIRSDIELLEAFLAGTLPDPEKKVVEERLLSDQEFINLYDTLKTLPQAARRSHLERKRDQLLELEERLRGGEIIGGEGEESGEAKENLDEAAVDQNSADVKAESKAQKRITRRWWMGVAAGLVILLGALFFMKDRRTEGEKVIDELFEPWQYSNQTRGGPELKDDIWKKAFTRYVQGQYRDALKFVEEIADGDLSTEQNKVKCHLLILNHKFYQAETVLEEIRPEIDSTWHSETRKWIRIGQGLESIENNPK